MDNQIHFFEPQENKPKSNKKILIVLLICIPLVVLTLIGVEVFLSLRAAREKTNFIINQQNKKQEGIIKEINSQPNNLTSSQQADKNASKSENIVNEATRKFFSYVQNIDISADTNDCVPWKRQDGVNFGLKGYLAQIGSESSKDNGKSDQIQQFFIDKGFIKNATNSYDSRDTMVPGPGKTVGFEDGNTKCSVSWSTSHFAKDMFTICCGDITSESENNFNLFYGLLGKPSEFCVIKNNGQFASGTVRSTSNSSFSSNDRWYSKNSGGAWSILWQGSFFEQPCASLKDFPKDFYERCK